MKPKLAFLQTNHIAKHILHDLAHAGGGKYHPLLPSILSRALCPYEDSSRFKINPDINLPCYVLLINVP